MACLLFPSAGRRRKLQLGLRDDTGLDFHRERAAEQVRVWGDDQLLFARVDHRHRLTADGHFRVRAAQQIAAANFQERAAAQVLHRRRRLDLRQRRIDGRRI